MCWWDNADANANANANAGDTDAYAYTNAGDTDAYTYTYACDTDANTYDANTNTYGYCDANTLSHPASADTKAAAYAVSTADSVIEWVKELQQK